MSLQKVVSLCSFLLAAQVVAAAEGPVDRDFEELAARLDRAIAEERLAAVEGLFGWALSAKDPSPARQLLESATFDRSAQVAIQAAHALRLLSHRSPGAESEPISEENRTEARARREAAQLQDLYIWSERLTHGDRTGRLQAIMVLAAHARTGSHRSEVRALLEAAESDSDPVVAAQARATSELLAHGHVGGARPTKGAGLTARSGHD